jgi:hypothetical protein
MAFGLHAVTRHTRRMSTQRTRTQHSIKQIELRATSDLSNTHTRVRYIATHTTLHVTRTIRSWRKNEAKFDFGPRIDACNAE